MNSVDYGDWNKILKCGTIFDFIWYTVKNTELMHTGKHDFFSLILKTLYEGCPKIA